MDKRPIDVSAMPRPDGTWTISEAKARLSELLRRAGSEGPQRIGIDRQYVVVPSQMWETLSATHVSSLKLGRWLAENMPRGEALPLPSRQETGRAIPFLDEDK